MNPNQPQAQLITSQFLRETKAKRQRLLPTVGTGFVENTTTRFQLPQAGLANDIYFYAQIPVTIAGTVTGGTWAKGANGAAPYNLIKRAQLYNNNSYYLRDLDGFSWYSWVRDRYAYDIASNNSNDYFSANASSALGVISNGVIGGNQVKAGVAIATGTFLVTIPLIMPVSYNHAGDRGLLVLPTENVYYFLDIQWGSIATGITATGGSSDLITGLTGTGLSVTVGTPVVKATIDYFMIPQGAQGMLDNFTNMFMSVTTSVQNINQNGQQNLLLPPNDYYTGVHVTSYANNVAIQTSKISNIVWQYAGQVTDIIDDQQTMLTRQAWLSTSQALPIDGKFFVDLGSRLGDYHRRDDFDAFNNQSVTGLQILYNIDASVTITGTSQAVIVYEALRPWLQAA